MLLCINTGNKSCNNKQIHPFVTKVYIIVSKLQTPKNMKVAVNFNAMKQEHWKSGT